MHIEKALRFFLEKGRNKNSLFFEKLLEKKIHLTIFEITSTGNAKMLLLLEFFGEIFKVTLF